MNFNEDNLVFAAPRKSSVVIYPQKLKGKFSYERNEQNYWKYIKVDP